MSRDGGVQQPVDPQLANDAARYWNAAKFGAIQFALFAFPFGPVNAGLQNLKVKSQSRGLSPVDAFREMMREPVSQALKGMPTDIFRRGGVYGGTRAIGYNVQVNKEQEVGVRQGSDVKLTMAQRIGIALKTAGYASAIEVLTLGYLEASQIARKSHADARARYFTPTIGLNPEPVPDLTRIEIFKRTVKTAPVLFGRNTGAPLIVGLAEQALHGGSSFRFLSPLAPFVGAVLTNPLDIANSKIASGVQGSVRQRIATDGLVRTLMSGFNGVPFRAGNLTIGMTAYLLGREICDRVGQTPPEDVPQWFVSGVGIVKQTSARVRFAKNNLFASMRASMQEDIGCDESPFGDVIVGSVFGSSGLNLSQFLQSSYGVPVMGTPLSSMNLPSQQVMADEVDPRKFAEDHGAICDKEANMKSLAAKNTVLVSASSAPLKESQSQSRA